MLKNIFIISLLSVLALVFSGCQLLDQFLPKSSTEEVSGEGEGSEEISDEESEEEGSGAEDDLFSLKPKPIINTYRPIAVTMGDGIKVIGTLYVPGISPYNPESESELEEEALGIEPESDSQSEEANSGPSAPSGPAKVKYPLIVLFHMLSGDRWEWKELPKQLVGAGYSVLAFDLRGHGESVYHGKRLKVWRQFDKSDWQKMPNDVDSLLEYISKKSEFNMVDTKRVGLIGASIGANIGANYASKHPEQVKAMVLLSPGLEYHGIETFNPLTQYENAIYFLASKEDVYATESAERLYKFSLGKKRIQIYQKLGHGSDMLQNNPELAKEIITWIKNNLPPQGKPDSDNQKSVSNQEESKPKTDASRSDTDKTPSDTKKTSKAAAPGKNKPVSGQQGKASSAQTKATASNKSASSDHKPGTTKAPVKPKPVSAVKKPNVAPILDEMLPLSKPGVTTPIPSPQNNNPASSPTPTPTPAPAPHQVPTPIPPQNYEPAPTLAPPAAPYPSLPAEPAPETP